MNALLPLWAIAVALLLLALAGLLWPLLREPAPSAGADHPATPDAAARERLRSLYRLQREELEREHERQSLGAEDRAQALEELDRRLLDDLDRLPQPVAATATAAGVAGRELPRADRADRPWLRRIPAAVLSLLLPVAALSLYLHVGDPLAAATLASAPPDTHTAGGDDAEAMVARLEERLRQQPDNLEGWLVLARSREVMEQFDAATRAYQQAVELAAQQQTPPTFQARLHADLADALASAHGGALDGPVPSVLNAALTLDPDQPKALALAGTAAVRTGDLDGARRHWRRLLALLEPGSDMALRVQSDLDTLDGAAPAGPATKAPATAAAPAPASAPQPQPQPPAGTAPAAMQRPAPAIRAAGLSGTVRLDPALRERVQPGDVVFIVVRTPSMGRMPVGLLRLTAAQLPAEFVVDDRHAMSPDLLLSKFDELSIEVRISRGGSTQRQAGEPISRPQSVKAGAHGLVLVVDALEPEGK